MELIVYYNIDKPLFKLVVFIPDAFDINSFVSHMKAIFGDTVIIKLIIN